MPPGQRSNSRLAHIKTGSKHNSSQGPTRTRGQQTKVVKLLRVRDVAEMFSISISLVYREVTEGRIRAYRIGKGALRFREEDILAYLADCEIQPKAQQKQTRFPALKNLKV